MMNRKNVGKKEVLTMYSLPSFSNTILLPKTTYIIKPLVAHALEKPLQQ